MPGCAPDARGAEEGLAASRSILNELVTVVIDEGCEGGLLCLEVRE